MKKIVYALLVLGCGVFPAQAQKEYGLSFSSLISDNLTLENAIRLGLENNSDFLTARQEIAVAEQKVNEAKFLFLPQFSLQGGLPHGVARHGSKPVSARPGSCG